MSVGWRKFALASFFALVGAVALFSGHIDGSGFLTLAGVVLGLYSGGNIIDKKLGGSG